MNKKWNLQDIRPSEPRRVRRPSNIESPNPRPANNSARNNPEDSARDTGTDSIPVHNGKKKQKRNLFVGITMLLLTVAGLFAVSIFMEGAEITVEPRHREPTVNATFTAYPERRSGELVYEIMTLSKTDESQVSASGEEQVETNASGIIEIIKNTPGSQQIVANTRFETPDGLIFRVNEPVLIPGASTDASGGSVPGTLRVEVTADTSGEEYNIDNGTRFTIPGFADSDLFDAIYAEARENFTGGFSGSQFAIQPEELSAARQRLQISLRDQLLEKIESERPAGFTVFPSLVTFEYNMLPATEYAGSLVTIKEEATMYVPLFNTDEFAAYIADASVPIYSGEPVRIDNLGDLVLNYESATTSQNNLTLATSLSFNITGTPQLVWTFDEERFIEEVRGQHRDSLQLIINDLFPDIERARPVIRPFFKNTYPDNPELITIIEEINR